LSQTEDSVQSRRHEDSQDLLQRSREELYDLYQFAPVAYLTLSRTGEILRINQKGREILSLEPKHPSNQSFEAFLSSDFRAAFRSAVEKLEETSSEVSLNLRIRTSRRSETWVLANIVPARPTDERGAALRLTLCLTEQQGCPPSSQAAKIERPNTKEDAMSLSERERLGRELHDKVCTNLTCLGLYLTKLHHSCPDAHGELLETCRTLAKEATGTIRNLITGLSSPVLEKCGLAAALLQEKQRLGPLFGDLTFEYQSSEIARLAPQIEEQILLIAREALSNAVRHSKGSRIKLRFESHREGFRLTITDDGVGIDRSKNLGWGLSSMNQRAESIKANLEIHSYQNAGTRVVLWQ